jgi:hypothetical protein
VAVVNVGAPADKDVGQAFDVECAVMGGNFGPYLPANIDVTLALSQVLDTDCVTMSADGTCTANFVKITFTLTMAVSPSGDGSTTPAVGAHTYDKDAVILREAREPGCRHSEHSEESQRRCGQNGRTLP